MKRPRVRHHTDDNGLDGIRAEGAIHLSRGWGNLQTGIHVEVELFATACPAPQGSSGPKNDMNCAKQGAYVEFDAPPEIVPYYCGPRNTALIPAKQPLSLAGLNPKYVRVRRRWWEFWRAQPE